MSKPNRLILKCHPETPGAAVDALAARVSRTGDMLTVVYTLDSDTARIRLPERRPACFTDNLWQHTCFEMFVREEGAEAYREFNFSPSGEWASYAFERYRERTLSAETGPAPYITCRTGAQRLELQVQVHPGRLADSAVLRLGLAAVIEDTDGALSYWALEHPAHKPDFHYPQAFTLALGREEA